MPGDHDRGRFLTEVRRGNMALIYPKGWFDFSGRRAFGDAVAAAIAEDAVVEIRIDFSDAAYVDSSVLGMLLVAQEKAGGHGKTISLSGAKGVVEATLKAAQFHKLFAFD